MANRGKSGQRGKKGGSIVDEELSKPVPSSVPKKTPKQQPRSKQKK